MSSQLKLQQVRVSFGHFDAVRDVSLSLDKGDIGCLLGPSGCGKTSLLRAIAGFEPLAAGEISINGVSISRPGITTPPEQRNVGMVFQDFALFPHLKIDRNVGFGLARMRTADRRRRVAQLLALVGLSDYARAYPHELSGGQQQRVALARAMAPSPDVLLLDEPFSSLDSEMREQLAGEVRQILKQSAITAILVTHDQLEAFAMADTVSLLHSGRVAQTDTPYNLYHNPASEFVASFMGRGSIISVSVDGDGVLDNGLGVLDKDRHTWSDGDTLRLLIRPDDIQHDPLSTTALKVLSKSFRGAEYLYDLELADGQSVPCMTSSHIDYAVGKSLPVTFNLQHLVVFGDASRLP